MATKRLPKPPAHQRKPRARLEDNPEHQALIERITSQQVPSLGTCTWMTSGTWDAPPDVCGRPVVAEWFRGGRRVSCLCGQHDGMARGFAARATTIEHRRVARW